MFYKMIIDGKSVIDRLREIVSQKPIEQAIKDCYIYFTENEYVIKGTNNIQKR